MRTKAKFFEKYNAFRLINKICLENFQIKISLLSNWSLSGNCTIQKVSIFFFFFFDKKNNLIFLSVVKFRKPILTSTVVRRLLRRMNFYELAQLVIFLSGAIEYENIMEMFHQRQTNEIVHFLLPKRARKQRFLIISPVIRGISEILKLTITNCKLRIYIKLNDEAF